MRKSIYVTMVLAFCLGLTAQGRNALGDQQGRPGVWRVGGTYTALTCDTTTNLLGSAWGGGAECSFSKALTADEALPGDISIAVYYRRFDHTQAGVNRTASYTSCGLKWRGGAGANPGSEGLYAGIEAAAAVLHIEPALDSPTGDTNVTKFEWSLFGGANFARWYFAEVGYSSASRVQDVEFGAVTVTLGARF